jgi:hypothetical protein
MNKLLLFLFTNVLLLSTVTALAQRGGGGGGSQMTPQQQQQFSDYYFPNTARTAEHLPCTPAYTPPVCNYIQNRQFNPTPGFNPTNPFGLGQIPFWGPSHGVPRLQNPLLGITVPVGVTNYALMPYAFSPALGQNQSSGIIQRIAPTQQGQNYVLRFFEKNASFFLLNPLARVDIFLIKCGDYQNFNINSNTAPAVPAANQHIFCETNYAASTQLAPWQNRVVTFTANDSYDMIWIYATPVLTGNFPQSFYCFAEPELINVTNFGVFNLNANDPGTCLASLYPTICLPMGATITWTGPIGQVFTGSSLIVDRSNPINAGVWTATLSFPTSDPHNSNCGNPLTVSTTINLTCCNCPPPNPNCINLPLVQ